MKFEPVKWAFSKILTWVGKKFFFWCVARKALVFNMFCDDIEEIVFIDDLQFSSL